MSVIFDYSDDKLILRHSADSEIEPDTYQLHSHDMNELYYLERGNVTYRVEGQVYKLLPGSLLLMRPGEIHCPHIHRGTVYSRLTLHFSSDALDGIDSGRFLLAPFFDREAGRKNLYLPGELTREAMTALNSLLFSAGEDSEVRLRIRVALCSLLLCLHTAFYCKSCSPALSMGEQLVHYIDENLTGRLCPETLSRHFFLSQSQCQRLFRQATGSSVCRYITLKRLTLARRLLNDGVPPGRACTECGFGDYSAFYRAYMRRYSVSPRDDRKK